MTINTTILAEAIFKIDGTCLSCIESFLEDIEPGMDKEQFHTLINAIIDSKKDWLIGEELKKLKEKFNVKD